MVLLNNLSFLVVILPSCKEYLYVHDSSFIFGTILIERLKNKRPEKY